MEPRRQKAAADHERPGFSDTAASEVRKPFVMDRFHFKQDYIGYLLITGPRISICSISIQNIDTLTTGLYDEGEPDFSPDGKQIVFSSNRTEDPDKNENADIYVMDAKPGAAMKKLTTWAGTDHAPKWSPDGKRSPYLQSSSDQNFTMYGQDMVAVMDAGGGNTTILSKAIDRPSRTCGGAKDGKFHLCIDRRRPRKQYCFFRCSQWHLRKSHTLGAARHLCTGSKYSNRKFAGADV